MADETPEEHKRRLKREQQQRFRDRKAAEAKGESLPPVRPGLGPGSRPYRKKEGDKDVRYRQTPGYGETREDYVQSQSYKESRARYEAKPESKASATQRKQQQRARGDVPLNYPGYKENQRKYGAKPERKASVAARNRQRRASGNVPVNHPKGRPARMPWLIRRPPQTEEERAAANRAMVAEKAQTSKYPTGKGTRNQPTVHRWWRRLGS